ncbi:MAG: hypothetical protein J6Y36_07655 [Treponema sp.]|nr:hypothetical protein [uncultured Treponema sp.]MBP5403016.1 hypothetical protein [Treponema sp.]
MKNSFILTAGYGWSGSSVIVDLLKEYDGIIDSDVEFRLIKDPHGLADLRYQLTKNWDVLTVDAAIKEFMRLASCMNHSSTKTTYGLGYDKKIGPNFMALTKSFIEGITSFSFQSNSWIFNLEKSRIRIVFEKILRKLHIDYTEGVMNFSQCTEEQFDNAVKKYLDSLFFSCGDKKVILDQAISPLHPEMVPVFFDDSKMLVVDRDPRDIYVNLIKGKNLIGAELSKSHDVNKYIQWHRACRKYKEELKSFSYVKQFQFEKLVCDYEKSVKEVESFLKISDKDHVNKKKYFIPEESSKNVGIWKKYPCQEEIRTIEKELPEYIINI